MAVTLDQDLDEDGNIKTVRSIFATDLLTAVMQIRSINKLHRIKLNNFTYYEAYMVRLKDDSVLVSTGNHRILSKWVTVDNENLVSYRARTSMGDTKLTFKHLFELEYTFL